MMEIFEWMKVRNMDVEEAVRLCGDMGVKSFRMVMNACVLMDRPDAVNEKKRSEYKKYIKLLRQNGVNQIIGMSGLWFLPENITIPDGIESICIPEIDRTTGSDYMRFLDIFETTWTSLAAAFPEIDLWETGNETNHDPYMIKLTDGRTGVFTREQKAEITVDMMLRATRAVKKANKNARTIMPALAPVRGIADMGEDLKLIYDYIKSGRHGETDTDCYFDALAWHPYPDDNGDADEKWAEANRQLFEIARRNGDGHKKVFLTEFGWPDKNDPELQKTYASRYKNAYRRIADMDFVESMHVYCLLEYPDIETSWGIYKYEDGSFIPKPQAEEIKKLFNGEIKL